MRIATLMLVAVVGCNDSRLTKIEERLTAIETQLGTNKVTTPDNGDKLDPKLALSLLRKQDDLINGFCIWENVEAKQHDAKTKTILARVNQELKCAKALEAAKIIKIGDCLTPNGPNACLDLAIYPVDGKISNGVFFDCGKIEILSVVSVKTEGNKALVKYEREAKIDKNLINRLNACPLDVPDEGKAIREREFHRNDAGEWYYQPPP